MSSNYKATCRCGSSIDVPYSDNFKEWITFHRECLKVQQPQEEPPEKAFQLNLITKVLMLDTIKALKRHLKR